MNTPEKIEVFRDKGGKVHESRAAAAEQNLKSAIVERKNAWHNSKNGKVTLGGNPTTELLGMAFENESILHLFTKDFKWLEQTMHEYLEDTAEPFATTAEKRS